MSNINLMGVDNSTGERKRVAPGDTLVDEAGSLIGGGGLDYTYDFGGSGAGRIITADSGAVRINKTSSDANNALEIDVSAGSGAGLVVTRSNSGALAVFSNTANSPNSNAVIISNKPSDSQGYALWLQARAYNAGSGPFDGGKYRATMRMDDYAPIATGIGPAIDFCASSDGGLTQNTIGMLMCVRENAIVNDLRGRMIFATNNTTTGAFTWADPGLAVTKDQYVQVNSAAVIGWTSGAITPNSGFDTGFSRTTAASIALGNGTTGNATGSLSLAKIVAVDSNRDVRTNYVQGGINYLLYLANTSLSLNGSPNGEVVSIREDGSLRLGYNAAQMLTFTSGAGADGSLTAYNYNPTVNSLPGEGYLQAHLTDNRPWVDGPTGQQRGGGLGFGVRFGPTVNGSSGALVCAAKESQVAEQYDAVLSFFMVQTDGHNLERMRLLSLTSKLQGRSDFTYAWTVGAASAAADTGLSRTAAASVAIGNGTQGDASGTLKVTTVQAPAATSLDLLAGNAEFFLNQNTVSTLLTSTPRTSFIPGEVFQVSDKTAFAAGVGGGITFSGISDAVPTGTLFAGIQGFKENGTSANQLGALRFFTNASAVSSALIEAGRFTSSGLFNLLSTGVLGFTASSSSTATADTGLSRTAAATIAIGNGTAGNVSGTLNATTLSASGAVYSGTNTPSTSNSYAVLQASDLDLVVYAASLPIGTASIRGISRRGTHASPTDATTGDHLLDIQAHGTTNGNPSAYISFIASAASGANSIPTDIAILQVATGVVVTALETFRFKNVGTLASTSTGVFGWCAAADLTTSADTGFSRLGAASVALGNGSAGNGTGSLTLSTVTSPAATNLALNAPTGQSVNINVNGSTVLGVLSAAIQADVLFQSIAALSLNLGHNYNIQVHDPASVAADVGGGLGFTGFVSGSVGALGSIRGRKENVTSGNVASYMVVYTNTDPTGAREAVRWDSAQHERHPSGSVIGWSSSSTNAAAIDAGLSRLGAASAALGNGSSGDTTGTLTLTSLLSATGTTLLVSGGTASGSDQVGTALTLSTGPGTGSGTVADVLVRTSYPLTTGTTVQTANNRFQARGKPVTLVNNTATEIYNVDVPNNSGRIGITIMYTVVYDDGTDYQTETGWITLSAVQVGAVFTTATNKFGNAQAKSTGTLTVTESVANNANNISLKINANSSLTPTTLRCFVEVFNNSDKNPVFA